MADGRSAANKAVETMGHKATPTRKLKKEQAGSSPTMERRAGQQAGTRQKLGSPKVRAHIEKGISELQGLHKLLLSSEIDPDVLVDFRDALNRVRNTAWAAQQFVVRKESGQGSSSVRSLLTGERIRVTYQLCQALGDDLKRTDIEFQAGSLVQLQEVTKALTERLERIIKRLG
ncbi:MAG: hypothetical protein ABSD75_00100 [Terriglobales bacterium]|jgi:hypothetical protein